MTSSSTLALTQRPSKSGPLESIDAFNGLVLEHQDIAYSLAYRLLGGRQAAEDAVQEAFLRAFAARRSFRGEHARAWLLRIVSNVARDELRRRRRRTVVSLDRECDGRAMADRLGDPGPAPERHALQADLRTSLERALRQLPSDQRLAVILTDVHGCSYAEVAQVMNVPVGTVKSRISRARAELRVLLSRGGIGPPLHERSRAAAQSPTASTNKPSATPAVSIRDR